MAASSTHRFRQAIGPEQLLSYAACYVADAAALTECVTWLRQQRHVGLDTETTGLDWRRDRVVTLQLGQPLGYDPRVYIIDLRAFTPAQLAPVFAVLADRTVTKVGMNLMFEGRFLRHQYGVRLRGVYDIQLAELALRSGLWSLSDAKDEGEGQSRQAYTATSMAQLAARHLQVTLDKDEDLRTSFGRTAVGAFTPRQLQYAAGDVLVPFYVAKAQRVLIEERQLADVIQIEMRCQPALVEAEVRGMRIDRKQWLKLWQESQTKLLETQQQLDALLNAHLPQRELFDLPNQRPIFPKTGKALNYDSVAQVKWALKEYCASVGWSREIVITKARLLELQQLYGREWRVRQAEQGRERTVAETPWWLIDRSQHCLLLDTKAATLKLARVRGELPRDLVTLLLDYAKYQIRADTFGKAFLDKHVEDGRVHTEFHQCLTSTGRLSSTPNCYDPATEILTQRGWVAFPELTDDDLVMQVDPTTRAASLVRPTARQVLDYRGDLQHVTSEQIELLVTPDHRLLVETRAGAVQVVTAATWTSDRKHFNAVQFPGGRSDLTPDQVRWLVAVQADGSWASGGIDLTFTRTRKIERLTALLETLGVVAPWRVDASGRHRMRLPGDHPLVQLAMTYLGPEKVFGSWILTLSRPALAAFAEEVWHWDGCITVRSQYCSVVRANADWVATACSLVGHRARLREYTNAGGTRAWVVDVTRRDYSWSTGATVTPVPYTGKVYCVTVPTGMVLVRRQRADGRVMTSVSGNCQNIPSDQRYRKCFIPTPGYRFVVLDFSQIEPRLSAQVSMDDVYVQTFQDGADIYLRVAEAMLGRTVERDAEGNLTAEWKLLRKIFKVVVLAMAYRMGPQKLHDTLTLALEDAITAGQIEAPTYEYTRDLHRRFLEIHVGIRTYQQLCEQLADPKTPSRPKLYDAYAGEPVTWIEAPCGRRRFFRSDATDTYTAAANSPIQGCSATITKYAMALVQDYIDEHGIDAYLLNSVHDELVWEVREDQALAFAPECKRLMEKAAATWITRVPVLAAYPEHSSTGVVDAWVKEV